MLALADITVPLPEIRKICPGLGKALETVVHSPLPFPSIIAMTLEQVRPGIESRGEAPMPPKAAEVLINHVVLFRDELMKPGHISMVQHFNHEGIGDTQYDLHTELTTVIGDRRIVFGFMEGKLAGDEGEMHTFRRVHIHESSQSNPESEESTLINLFDGPTCHVKFDTQDENATITSANDTLGAVKKVSEYITGLAEDISNVTRTHDKS